MALKRASPGYDSPMRTQRERDYHDDYDREREQRHLDPALRVFALDRAGEAVDHRLKRFRAVVVVEQPDRRQDMLEHLPGVIRSHFKVAVRVASTRASKVQYGK